MLLCSNTKLGHKSSNYPGSIEWTNLGSLTKGLAGGAAVKRSAFLLENLDIPQVRLQERLENSSESCFQENVGPVRTYKTHMNHASKRLWRL